MITINKALCDTIRAHSNLDSQVKELQKDLIKVANKPFGKKMRLRDFVASRTAAVGAKICDSSLSLGCGIGVAGAMEAAGANIFEACRTNLMTRERSDALLQLLSTATVLGAKIGFLAAGSLVVAPLVGLAWGLHSWSQQGTDWKEPRSGHIASSPSAQTSAAIGPRKRPDGVHLAEVMARHGARTVAALDSFMRAY